MTYKVAVLALGVALLATVAPANSLAQVTIAAGRAADGDARILVGATASRSPILLLGVQVQAQPIAFRTQPDQGPKKGAWEFFLEFIDFSLKALSIIGVLAIVFATVRLWFHDRAAAKRRGDIRICPYCYALVPQHKMTHCRHCRAELPPAARTEAPPARAAAVHQTARQVSVRTAQSEPVVFVKPIGSQTARQAPTHTPRAPVEPIYKEPVRQEPTPAGQGRVGQVHEEILIERASAKPIGGEPAAAYPERTRPEPIHEESFAEDTDVTDEDEWEGVDWEVEEQAKRRKVFVYAFLSAITVGYLVMAIIFLFYRF